MVLNFRFDLAKSFSNYCLFVANPRPLDLPGSWGNFSTDPHYYSFSSQYLFSDLRFSSKMTEFLDLESQDGVRMPWNVMPGTKQESTNCVVPVSAIYTPIKGFPELPVLPYSPLRCRTCRSILNPFSIVDFAAKLWICPFCFQRNHFPAHYASISDDNLPGELFPQYTTIEYASPEEALRPSMPPVFVFVLDTCIIEEELGFLKSALLQAIGLLPGNALVGLVTFGTLVQVHELGFGAMPKSYVFKGSKEVTKEQLLEQMSFFAKKPKPATGVIAGARDGLDAESIARFLVPASECEFAFNAVILRNMKKKKKNKNKQPISLWHFNLTTVFTFLGLISYMS